MKLRRGIVLGMLAVACLCIVFTVIFTACYSSNEKLPLKSEFHLLRDDTPWQVRLGCGAETVLPGETLEGLDGALVIAREVFPEEMGENILFFNNNRQCFSVHAEGELLYELGMTERHFKFGASCYCAVPLPEKGRAYEIQFTFDHLEDERCEVPELYYGSLNDVLIYVGMLDMSMLVFLPILLIIGIVLVVLWLILVRTRRADRRIFSLALFLIVTASWNISDMHLINLLPIDLELNSAFCHLFLMIMPLPVMSFIDRCCEKRPPFMRFAVTALLLGNIIAQTALYALGIANLHEMVMASQALLVLLLFYGVISTRRDYAAAPTKVGKVQAGAFALSALLGALVCVAYWLQPVGMSLYRTFFQGAVMIFLVLMVGVVIYSLEDQHNQSRLRDAELSAYRVISTIDQLTGLKNRRAFDQMMQKIEDDPAAHPDALLVFMDLNGLKYANDKYGHMAGDELIIAAARCINEVFGKDGTTYRVGGDEFAAIIPGCALSLAPYFSRMDAEMAAYNENADVPLSIARGGCSLITPNGRRLTVSDWKMFADKRMYEDKVINHRIKPRGSAEDYLELISSFVSAVDAKDSYTADHSQRVGSMTDRICGMLGLSEASQNEIHMAACLHDIGKIGIPDSILRKADNLTGDEWLIMQSHTLVGEEIIKHNRAFYEVSQIIRHHHERVDGKGYPDGISGNEIPLGARIIAIADSIDAMTSSRSYRAARSLAFCKEEIRRNLGVMYDAAIGEIVLEHWNEIEEIILSCRSSQAIPPSEMI